MEPSKDNTRQKVSRTRCRARLYIQGAYGRRFVADYRIVWRALLLWRNR